MVQENILSEKIIGCCITIHKLLSLHWKQVLTYLKLANLRLGLLVNFNTTILKEGINRIVNNL